MRTAILSLLLLLISNFTISAQWADYATGVITQLNSAIVTNYGSNVWVCGDGGVVRKSFDGANWFNVNYGLPSTQNMVTITSLDTSVALVASYLNNNTWVYKTTNGGYNLLQVFNQPNGYIHAI